MPESTSTKDRIFLLHIHAECQKILGLIGRITHTEYLEDNTYQDALCHRIEIIGEAAGNLSSDFAKQYPYLPIREMKAMRNILAHQYFRVDIEYVWLVVTNDIPPLFEQISDILNSTE